MVYNKSINIDWRYIMAITLSKQYNFKLNEATMEQARNIIKAKGHDHD